MNNMDHLNAKNETKPALTKGNGKAGKAIGVLSEEEIRKREHDAILKIINMTCIVSTADKRGDILSVNDKLCEVSQYDREECIGNPHNMFRHPDSPKSLFKELWNTIGTGNIFRGKIKNRKKDGLPYYVDATICPVLGDDGRPIKYIGVRYDITDQEIERQNMKGIIDAIDQAYAFIEFDTRGNILNANANFLNTVGYQLSEIQGKHHSIFVDPAFVKTMEYENFWKELANGTIFNDEFKRFGKNGAEIWIRAVYAPVKDEMGRVFKVIKIATDITKQKQEQEYIIKKVDVILDIVKAASEGDLTQEITVDGDKPIDLIAASLKTFFHQLRQTVQSISNSSHALTTSADEMTSNGQQMAGNAEETSAQSNLVSAAAEEVSQNIQTVAAAAEQLNASINEIAKNAIDAAQVANQAVVVTEDANRTMVKLGESSTEIGNVVKVITSIAQQTNLLALNATIEAARAGEAGKGFAVVANEVKELAKETAKATEDISRKIETIQADTQESLNAITKISNIIKQINETQNTIASAVEEQAATTSEIGRNVSEAAKGGSEISENIMSVAQAAQDTAKGAMSSQESARELANMAGELQKIVSQFTC